MFGSYVGIGTASPDTKLHAFGDGYYQSALTLTREDTSEFTGSVIFEKKKVDGSDDPTPLVTGDRIIQIYSQGYSNTAGDIRYGPEIVADLTADAVSGEALQADTKFVSNGNTNFAVHYDGDVTARGAYNTDQVRHNIRPTLNLDFANSKELDPRITFYRDSIATYYDSKGVLRYANTNTPRFDHDPATGESKGLLIEEARTNIASAATLEVPLTFNNMYINKFMEVAPDRTYSGHHVLASPGVSRHEAYLTYPSTLGLVYTASVYVKPLGAVTWLSVSRSGTIDTMAFDLINLTTNIPGGTASGSISDAGNGWKKIEFTFTEAIGGNRSVYLSPGIGAPSSSVYTNLNGDGANGVALWGMQVEQASFATSYIPSDTRFTSRSSVATYHDENGILRTAPANSPRYGYKYDGRKWVETGLILESAATNYFKYKEPGWISNYSYIPNVTPERSSDIVAPDGSSLTTKLAFSANGNFDSYQSSVLQYGSQMTLSLYVYPPASGASWSFGFGDAPADYYIALFTYSNGEMSTSNPARSGYEKVGNTGWWRIWATNDITNESGGPVSYLFNNQSGAKTYYLWGMQAEIGYRATSWIGVNSSSSTTRSADVASSVAYTRAEDRVGAFGNNVTSWYNDEEGTVYTEDSVELNDSYAMVWYLGTSESVSDGYISQFQIGTGGTFNTDTRNNGGADIDVGSGTQYNAGDYIKRAIGLKENDTAAGSRGIITATDTNGRLPVNVSVLYIGSRPDGYRYNGHMKKFVYYPERLSNAELQALTENN